MIRIKQGDNLGFSSPLEITLDGVPVTDFTGWSATFSAEDARGLVVSSGACVLGAGVVGFQLAIPADANIGKGAMDIKFTGPGVILHTVTVPVVIEKAITP